VDKVTGLIRTLLVTPANKYDGHMLEAVVKKTKLRKGQEVLADKGYFSKDNTEYLEKKKLVSKIMRKKTKNQVPSAELIEYNRKISEQRYVIERSFGSLKRHNGWARSIYMGLQKTKDYLLMGAIAFNIKRSIVLLS
jgi:IS5 family transposase